MLRLHDQSETDLHLELASHLKEHGYFTGASDKIELKMQNGRNVIAARQAIDVGEVVAVDKAFTKTLFTIYGWKCQICLKSNTNLVPCKRCTTAMFCHECNENDLHKYECRMKTSKYSAYNNYLMHELRTFFVALNLFADADQMMEFVEQSLNNADTPITDLSDDRSRYNAFLNVKGNSSIVNDRQFIPIVFSVYKILLEIPKVCQ